MASATVIDLLMPVLFIVLGMTVIFSLLCYNIVDRVLQHMEVSSDEPDDKKEEA